MMRVCPTKDSWSYKMLEGVFGNNVPSNICWYFLTAVCLLLVYSVLLFMAVSFLVGLVGGLAFLFLGAGQVGFLSDYMVALKSLGDVGAIHGTLGEISAVVGFGAGILGPFIVAIATATKLLYTLVKTKTAAKITKSIRNTFRPIGNINIKIPIWVKKTCQLCKEIDFDKGEIKK